MESVDRVFAALSDRLRLRCVLLLAREGELCVCELVDALDVVQPKISRHLATLRTAGIVVARREAQWLHYRLDPDRSAWLDRIVEAAAKASADDPDHRADRARLAASTKRVPRPRSTAGGPEGESTRICW
jgi:ArsR family transcriptional regulator